MAAKHVHEYAITHTHTTVLRLCGICPGQPAIMFTKLQCSQLQLKLQNYNYKL